MEIFNRIIVRTIQKYLVPIILVVLIVATIGNKLLPADTMFLFHDKTQYARILDFASALKTWHIPPIWATHFNFGIGYPIFMFYAPVAYWASSTLYLLGLTVIDSVRLSMLLAVAVGGCGMYAWLAKRYAQPAAFVGAILFVASPWFASEMFVRGNLATIWFLALAPWSLWALHAAHRHKVISALLISLTFMAHNVLSLIWMPTILIYAVFTQVRHRTYAVKFIILTIAMSGVFWIPALLQLGQTHATEIAQLTNFRDHFLCVEQLWTTPTWGFGGSTQGCVNDGMSFMLGKAQIMLALIGITLGSFVIQKRRSLYIEGLIAMWALFLSLYDAQLFWEIVQPLQVVQFPWRFLSIALIFMAALSAAAIQVLIEHIKIVVARDRLGLNKIYKRWTTNVIARVAPSSLRVKLKKIVLPPLAQFIYTTFSFTLGVAILIVSTKYFYGRTLPVRDIDMQFASETYIRESAAYDVPEYVPKSVDYTYWQTFRTQKPNPVDIVSLQRDFSSFHPNTLYRVGAGILSVISFILIICLL
ncbi:hypothetical protein KBB12_01380 [Candidatus Woesebacteria bacterium]|nr:hypothetical protein [Candidatus Woesebacteria bacterium]